MSADLPIVLDKLKAGEPLANNYLDFLDSQADSLSTTVGIRQH